jgi:riboflavin kinase/FMN adenylyltransferase
MIIKGKVIHGKQKATSIGFPTANIALKEEEHIAPGIYAGRAFVNGQTFKAALYVGKANPRILEVHLIGFEGELYGKEIEVTLLDKVRDDFYISDESKLKEIIANDIEMIQIELDKDL